MYYSFKSSLRDGGSIMKLFLLDSLGGDGRSAAYRLASEMLHEAEGLLNLRGRQPSMSSMTLTKWA